jgi:Chromo (CHRromatin Organisation MOdifier) domain
MSFFIIARDHLQHVVIHIGEVLYVLLVVKTLVTPNTIQSHRKRHFFLSLILNLFRTTARPCDNKPCRRCTHDVIIWNFFVNNILSHRGFPEHSQIEFLIKWQDYPESENSWEPYENLRDVDKLHDYLRQHNLQKLINKQHC